MTAAALPPAPIAILHADPDSAAARACLSAYAALLARRIDGITAADLPHPDPDAADYRPPRGCFLIAQRNGLALACIALKTLSPGVGEVKRLWVDEAARGAGLARRLLRQVEQEARTLGLAALKLDTNAALTEAIALYRSEGWAETDAYTAFPATHWFSKPL